MIFIAARNLKVMMTTLLVFTAFSHSFSQNLSLTESLTKQQKWVDSVFHKLNRKQRVAQLLMVRAHTNKGKAFEDSIARVIAEEQVGGLVFFQGGPVRQAQLTNRYQKIASVPLLIAMDAEWGLGMRLDSTASYPYQMTLGAIQDNMLIYKMGVQVAKDFKRLGMQMNFAPDMDVNNNPDNPVIGYRSFGDNKYNVSKKGIAYMQGMQDGGILTTAKHFPGHGDTNVDSHYDLPQLTFTKGRLDSLEMYPFQEAVDAGISGVMVAHMNIPALDSTKNLPSTLSRPIITGQLKEKMGFDGLIVTDAMEMKGVVKNFPGGVADVMAIAAGNDVIELSENSERAVKLIMKAVRKCEISRREINAKIKKVLAAKYWVGLNDSPEISLQQVVPDLNRPEAKVLNQQLTDAAITLLQGDTILSQLDSTKKTALVSFGVVKSTLFQTELQKQFSNNTVFLVGKNTSVPDMDKMLRQLNDYDQIIVGVHDTRKRPASKLDYGSNVKLLISELAGGKSIISVFANPYVIAGLPGIEKSKALLMGYQMMDEMEISAAKVISKSLKPSGKLPVNVNTYYKFGDGITIK
ncbi:MAG: glycoside hydrolase family 3 protein [Sphingobacteriaceae bacterium]